MDNYGTNYESIFFFKACKINKSQIYSPHVKLVQKTSVHVGLIKAPLWPFKDAQFTSLKCRRHFGRLNGFYLTDFPEFFFSQRDSRTEWAMKYWESHIILTLLTTVDMFNIFKLHISTLCTPGYKSNMFLHDKNNISTTD
jgi:hypothetical protein